MILFYHFIFFSFFLIFEVQGKNKCSNMIVLETGGISCEEILEILQVHNEMRELVAKGMVKKQPSASNMQEMYWDKELAEGAQKWANECVFEHNSQKAREVERFKVGQNIAQTKTKNNSSDLKEFRKRINKWFNEHQHFEFGPIRRVSGPHPTGHYTQIIWANTFLIGCGYSRFKNQIGVTYKLYVCHYGPTGNKINELPYKTGTRKCPSDQKPSDKYPNLCSLKKTPLIICEQNEQSNKTENQTKSKFSESRRFLYPSKDEKKLQDNNKESVNYSNNRYFKMFFINVDKLII